MLRSALPFLALAWGASAAPAADLVSSLPGWDGALPSKIYSGFLDAGSDEQSGVTYNAKMWYMLVEAEEEPMNKPLLLWVSLGPRRARRAPAAHARAFSPPFRPTCPGAPAPLLSAPLPPTRATAGRALAAPLAYLQSWAPFTFQASPCCPRPPGSFATSTPGPSS